MVVVVGLEILWLAMALMVVGSVRLHLSVAVGLQVGLHGDNVLFIAILGVFRRKTAQNVEHPRSSLSPSPLPHQVIDRN